MKLSFRPSEDFIEGIFIMKKNLTHEEFLERLPKNREYEVIGRYVKATERILIKDKYGYCRCFPNTLYNSSKTSVLSAINPTEYYINRFKEVHSNIYDYSKFIYRENSKNSIITCPIHGDFEQTPCNHVNGKGCRKCSIIKNSKKRVSNISSFIKKANKVHNSLYSYENSIYINKRSKIQIICPLHGEFLQLVSSHLTGNGCSRCASDIVGGYSKSDSIRTAKGKECTFYILRLYNENEEFYKIGITSNSVKKRFVGKRNMPYSYEILQEIKGEAGEIWDLELKNKRLLKDFKYISKVKFRGYTECFTNIDILLRNERK